MAVLDSGALLSPKPTIESVSCPEMGGEILVRPLSGREREKIEKLAKQAAKNGDDENAESGTGYLARLVAWCVVDTSGTQIFGEDRIEAAKALPGVTLDRLVKKITEISILDRKAFEEAKNDLGEASSAGSSSG